MFTFTKYFSQAYIIWAPKLDVPKMVYCCPKVPKIPPEKYSVNVYDTYKKQSHSSEKPENDNIKIKYNGDGKIKIMVVGDPLVKYLRREESCPKNNVKVISHLGSTTKDMLDYIKPIARRKPDTLIIHTGTNGLTNGVNTKTKVRKLVELVREIEESEKLTSVFPLLFNAKIKTLRMNEMR